MKSHARGFVALMSVIIVSAILTTIIFTLGASTFFARFDVLDIENKRESLSLAQACVNAAMLKIARDASYAALLGGDQVTIQGLKTCKICPGTNSPSGQSTEPLYARALYNGAYTNIEATIHTVPGSFAISGWRENAGGDSSCTLP